jgi:DeoR/GlpR family transcriptional regulator of sugar metabolism
MLDATNMKILAVDKSKFDKISFTKISDLSNVDVVVTDAELNDKWKKTFETLNIQAMHK